MSRAARAAGFGWITVISAGRGAAYVVSFKHAPETVSLRLGLDACSVDWCAGDARNSSEDSEFVSLSGQRGSLRIDRSKCGSAPTPSAHRDMKNPAPTPVRGSLGRALRGQGECATVSASEDEGPDAHGLFAPLSWSAELLV